MTNAVKLRVQPLFGNSVGLKGNIAHLYEEFLNLLGGADFVTCVDRDDKGKIRCGKTLGKAAGILWDARKTGVLKPEAVTELVRAIDDDLSPEQCQAWFRPPPMNNDLPQVSSLSGLIRQTPSEDLNARYLGWHRAAGYLTLFRPDSFDLQTLCDKESDAEVARKFGGRWNRLDARVRATLVEDLFYGRGELRELVSDEQERGPIELSDEKLRIVWETRELDYLECAKNWDLRRFYPYRGLGNFDCLKRRKEANAWRNFVSRQRGKASRTFTE